MTKEQDNNGICPHCKTYFEKTWFDGEKITRQLRVSLYLAECECGYKTVIWEKE